MALDLNEIVDNFESLDDWDDRYRYLIELGRELEPLDAVAHNDHNKVRGCASQVWVETTVAPSADGVTLNLRGDSDAHIVRGLIALVFALYSGQTTEHILATDAQDLFQKLGLSAHLTPQRSNGVRAMVERIKTDARSAAAAPSV
ncbi:SufE family protein [Beijerinckia sp. L45]|uniref:SufE family protein n=1 Tax=Beijerinckia sp. L45 TaxID=1641855 RepID=UPI00131CC33D|nr:SufE family protein [Beijerinckia sp. L45]